MIRKKDVYWHLDSSVVSDVLLVSKINDIWIPFMKPLVNSGEFIKIEAKDHEGVVENYRQYHSHYSRCYAYVITDLGKALRDLKNI